MKDTVHGILKWSEQYTKTDMKYVARGSFWMNLSHAISMIAGFILSIAFAKYLTQTDLGMYKYILALISFIGSFSLSGLGTAMVRAIAKGAEGEYMHGFWINIRWGFFASLITIALSIYYFINGNTTLGIGLLIGGVFSPLLDSGELYTTLHSGRKDFRTVNIYKIARSLFIFAVLLIAIYTTDNPYILVGANIVSSAVSALLLFYITYKKFHPNHVRDTETVRLGKHLSVINLLATLADRIDSILIFQFLGPIQLAIYNYAIAIPNNIGGLTKQIGSLATPKYVHKEKTEVQHGMFYKSSLLFIVMLPVAILYFFLAPYIFDLLFSQYTDSIKYSQLYIVTILISGVLPLAFLDAHTAIKEKYIISIVSNIVKIAILVCGIYYFGIWGAIVGRILSKTFGVSLAFFFAQRL